MSSKNGKRLEVESGSFEMQARSGIKLQLDLGKTYQTMLGFGGAFTDAAGLNIKTLSNATQEQLMK